MEPFKIEKNITLQQVKDAKPKMIFYGANTAWWTHDPAHLGKTGPLPESFRPPGAREDFGAGMPCDPIGGMLYQTDKPMDFLATAEANAAHYGKHRLEAFMAAHHLNCKTESGEPWAFRTFTEYNAIIDQQNQS